MVEVCSVSLFVKVFFLIVEIIFFLIILDYRLFKVRNTAGHTSEPEQTFGHCIFCSQSKG